ncbi:hypothetical protein K1F50_15855 [Muricauda oceani]|uniref:Uncharacterized protein n=1 Tax=Flagellimonas oceani TaxID=2698672 RepID=A0A6G7J094_9FLAO|nr:hypothetical protein [Allomuricauda oceani]MBW8244284.1 hypothetical protein [Allomuricauda oceani]QII44070.1 hypothetical protein GVT53_05080 [Allomuricauda oceani]
MKVKQYGPVMALGLMLPWFACSDPDDSMDRVLFQWEGTKSSDPWATTGP